MGDLPKSLLQTVCEYQYDKFEATIDNFYKLLDIIHENPIKLNRDEQFLLIQKFRDINETLDILNQSVATLCKDLSDNTLRDTSSADNKFKSAFLPFVIAYNLLQGDK